MNRGKKGNQTFFFVTIAIGLLSALLSLFLYVWSPRFLKEVDLRYSDFRFKKLRGVVNPASDTVIVAIDEKSVNELGRWPWSRKRIAELVEKLKDYNAKVISFDVIFSEAESDNADGALSSSIKRAGNVILGYYFRPTSTQGLSSESFNQLNRSGIKLIKFIGKPKSSFIGEFPFVELNIPQIGVEADGFGFFNFPNPDTDGVFRRAQLLLMYDGEIYPSLDLESIRHYLERDILLELASYGVEAIYVGQTKIPTNEKGEILINYYGPTGTFPTFSAVDVISGKIPKENLKDKLIFIGATEIGIYDARSTPFDASFPGVEIHATVAGNILEGRFLIQNNLTKVLDLILLFTLPIFLVLLLKRAEGTFIGLSILLAFVLIHLLLNYVFFARFKLVLSALYPSLSLAFAYVFFEGYRNLVIEKRSRYLRMAFSSYVSPALVTEILHNPDKLKLGGENRIITVLFSDIRGFTTLSEKTTPELLVSLLNEYLSPMTQIVMNERGTLDKYIGDAIMAIFGAPLDVPDHSRRACITALGMLEKLEKLNQEWEGKGWPRVSIGVGINTGEAIVGNMGSNVRFDYTAIGDTVNLASRLEGLNKFYGTEIIISKSTLDDFNSSGSALAGRKEEPPFLVRELDLVQVKGKYQQISIFELMGLDAKDSKKAELVDLFMKALNLYREQRFYEAKEAFSEVLKNFPGDEPSALYIKRCSDYMEIPPPVDWDGVYITKEK
jgi:adenylate cyclase